MAGRRNLLILLPRGLRSDALSDERAWPLTTPHLDRLGARGLRVVAGSACPADDGGMISLLTGLHARQHGCATDGGTLRLTGGLPAWLRARGYHVAGVGQVGFMRDTLDQALITRPVSELRPKNCAYFASLPDDSLRHAISQQRRQRQRSGPVAPDRLLLDTDQDIDGFIARRAIEALEAMPDDRPWALLVLFAGPGCDLPPPMLYEQMVSIAELRRGFHPPDFRRLDALADPPYPRALLQRLEPRLIARVRADYLGRVAMLDHAAGQMMRVIASRPDADRTWTALCSDRGHLLGEQGLLGHRSFLAGALETPLIVTPPEGSRVGPAGPLDALASTVDFAVTVGELAGCDVPEATAGRSLLPVFTGEPVSGKGGDASLSEFHDRVMLETDRVKAMFDRSDGRCIGLYDLLHDPEERTNIVEQVVGRNQVDQVRWRLAGALLPLRAVWVGGDPGAADPAAARAEKSPDTG